MISVKVRDQDRVDLVAFDSEVGETRIRGPTAVEEKGATLTAHQYGGLPPAAGPESVARTDEDDFVHFIAFSDAQA